jgi:polysaccharide pyruvyl transferase WcaK-like protein
LLRDPLSADRATGDGVVNVTRTADLVFLAKTVDPPPVSPPARYAIVNVSGLIARSADHTPEYVRIVEYFRSVGVHVVLLPHVIKPLTDDLAACSALAKHVGDRGVTLISTLLTPAEVRGLAAGAEFTVTGRMHLAVMSLLGGTPAVALATQGKVEGLMQLFGAPQLCVPPVAGFADPVIALARDAAAPTSKLRRSIDDALPAVVELAARNTAGLLDASPAGSVPLAAGGA